MILIIISILILLLVVGVFSYLFWKYMKESNEKYEKRKEEKKSEQEKRDRQRQEINRQIIDLKESLGDLDSKKNKIERKLDNTSNSVEEIEQIHNDILPDIEDLKENLSSLKERVDAINSSNNSDAIETMRSDINTLEENFDSTIDELKDRITNLEEQELTEMITDSDIRYLKDEIKDRLNSLQLEDVGINGYDLKQSSETAMDTDDINGYQNPEKRFDPHTNALKIRNNDVERDGLDVNNLFIRNGQLSFESSGLSNTANTSIVSDSGDLNMYLPKSKNFNISNRKYGSGIHSFSETGTAVHSNKVVVPQVQIGNYTLEVKDGELVAIESDSENTTVLATSS